MSSGRGNHGSRKAVRGRLVKRSQKPKHRPASARTKKRLDPAYAERRNLFYAFFTRLAAGKEEPPQEEKPAPKRSGWGKKPVEEEKGDDVSKKLQRSGVYHIKDGHTYAKNDFEGPRFTSPVSYSFWSGAKYCLLLSLFLWWFPLVGNIIAGYIGGRRAGGPWRGLFACLLPVIVLMILQYGHEHNLLPAFVVFIIQIPEMARAALMSDAPAAAPYYTASMIYVTGFVGYLQELVRFQMNLYVVTIIFGYVGGAVAQMRLSDQALGSSASDSNSSSNSNVVVNVHGAGGRGAAEEEDDGFSTPRAPGRSAGDGLPSHSPSSRPLPPVAAAALALRGPNWRRRRLRGELQAERDAKGMAGRARVRRADELDDVPGSRAEAAKGSYFRVESRNGEGAAPGASLAARRREGRQGESSDEEEEFPIPKEFIRSHTPAQEPAHRSREIERPARDRVKQLEDEGEELESRRALGHRPAHAHGSPAHHVSHVPEPRALPARAVRKVPKLERGDDEERSRSSGQPVHDLHRAAPRVSAAEHAARLVKEKRIHHSAKGEDESDDEEDVKGKGHGDATEGDDVPEKRQDEIQKLVQRALHGTGPANFQVKKEAEHNWEVL